jgi:hypothetical protein
MNKGATIALMNLAIGNSSKFASMVSAIITAEFGLGTEDCGNLVKFLVSRKKEFTGSEDEFHKLYNHLSEGMFIPDIGKPKVKEEQVDSETLKKIDTLVRNSCIIFIDNSPFELLYKYIPVDSFAGIFSSTKNEVNALKHALSEAEKISPTRRYDSYQIEIKGDKVRLSLVDNSGVVDSLVKVVNAGLRKMVECRWIGVEFTADNFAEMVARGGCNFPAGRTKDRKCKSLNDMRREHGDKSANISAGRTMSRIFKGRVNIRYGDYVISRILRNKAPSRYVIHKAPSEQKKRKDVQTYTERMPKSASKACV